MNFFDENIDFFSEETENNTIKESYTLEDEQIINEAILKESGVLDILTEESLYELADEGIISERSIVRLDKIARRNRAITKTAILLAKENNDKLYAKLVKVYKQKKALLNQINKKYGNKATAKVKKNAMNQKTSLAVNKQLQKSNKVNKPSADYLKNDSKIFRDTDHKK